MTKQEFLDGKWFKLKELSSIAYKYSNNQIYERFLTKATSPEVKEVSAQVTNITSFGFKGYGFVMNKKVDVYFEFDNLILVKE